MTRSLSIQPSLHFDPPLHPAQNDPELESYKVSNVWKMLFGYSEEPQNRIAHNLFDSSGKPFNRVAQRLFEPLEETSS